MKLCKLGGAAQLVTEWAPRLDAALSKLKNTADAHAAARDVYLDAFKQELALRNEHFHAIDKLMGLVRAAFPQDRARQDLVFPPVDASEDLEASESDETSSQESAKPE